MAAWCNASNPMAPGCGARSNLQACLLLLAGAAATACGDSQTAAGTEPGAPVKMAMVAGEGAPAAHESTADSADASGVGTEPATAKPVNVPEAGTGSMTPGPMGAGQAGTDPMTAGTEPVDTDPVDTASMTPDGMGAPPSGADSMGADPMETEPVQPGTLSLPAPDEVGPFEAVEVENVGEGFENAIASGDQGDGLGCVRFIMSFGQDEEGARNYAMIPEGHDMALYTLYRPAEMPEGRRFPALSWANGTCAHPVGYAPMIKHIVSHGFIVVAAHSRYTGSGAAQVNGLNYLVAENDNPDSELFGRIDTDALGIFGHSQGSSSTAAASDDPRVRSVVFMHGGTANPDAPALYLTSDLEARGVMRGYNSATGQAAYGRLEDSDHITMMVEHERMAPEVTAWFRYTLLADEEAATWFVGSDCVLCGDSEWEFMAKGL